MAHYFNKQLLFGSLLVLSFSAQADLQKPFISAQLAYENLTNQTLEIVDYDVARDFQAVKNIVNEGSATLGGPFDEEMMQKLFVHQNSCNRFGKKTIIKVARINGQVAGVMTFVHGYYGHVELLAVGSQFRNKGIGYKLLSTAQELAQQRNAQGLELYVFNHNAPAIKLYEKFGFKQEAFVGNNLSLMAKPFNAPEMEQASWVVDTQIPRTILV